jgi:hypothetical protein
MGRSSEPGHKAGRCILWRWPQKPGVICKSCWRGPDTFALRMESLRPRALNENLAFWAARCSPAAPASRAAIQEARIYRRCNPPSRRRAYIGDFPAELTLHCWTCKRDQRWRSPSADSHPYWEILKISEAMVLNASCSCVAFGAKTYSRFVAQGCRWGLRGHWPLAVRILDPAVQGRCLRGQ